MNNVSLVGRLTKDPELRTIPSGNVTTTVTVAINRPFANQAGERLADFISVVVWNKQAENLAKYCKKGSLIGVIGRIQTRSYDAQDGTKRYVTEVMAENIQFLSSKNDTGSGYQSPEPSYNSGNTSQVETTDISEDPFKDFGSEVVLSDDDLPF
ncbi:MAG: single-stranded DNA-binding protein [Bacilli bacterium]|nr:single-stranded DNA-binding protein [Bacilli bacterium]MDD4795484.1 single-stranded DNA-binding protein [Bacilli bacterium]